MLRMIGRPRKRKSQFSESEIETAIRVLISSRYVKNWVNGELRAFDFDPESEEGKRFYEREARRIAIKLVRQ